MDCADHRSRQVMTPEVLILAGRLDFECDYVASQLKACGTTYFRLNTEDFDRFGVIAMPDVPRMILRKDDMEVRLETPTLKAILFRRAVYPREAFASHHSPHEQLTRSHVSVFMRSFMVFDSCLWVNHPVATYRAEHKALQIATAKSVGFTVPRTVITNDAAGIREASQLDEQVAIKGLDTIWLRQGDIGMFGYTTLMSTDEAQQSNLSTVPLLAQQALANKLDLRVTMVGNEIFCSSVVRAGKSIDGDWRLVKDGASFQPFDLPPGIVTKCFALTDALGLTFAAIDLALQDGVFYFLEVNPTGQWAWLLDHQPIDVSIAHVLRREQ